MNDTYDGRFFVCPEGSNEWQDGYRDAMGHHGRHSTLFMAFDDPAGEYAAGYRRAVRDILDHAEKAIPVAE